MGSVPSWYRYIAAARWLGVPPWDLVKQPKYWLDWAESASNAEAEAQKAEMTRQQNRQSQG